MKHCLFLSGLTAATLLISMSAYSISSALFSDEILMASADEMMCNTSGAPSEYGAWLFDTYFEDVTLTAEQQEFAVTEVKCYEQAFLNFSEEQAEQDQTWTGEEIFALEEAFLNQLSTALSTEQMQQVRQNIELNRPLNTGTLLIRHWQLWRLMFI